MKTFFAVALLLFTSCGSKTTIPKDVLPVAKMTEVLWDVLLADALVTGRYPAAGNGSKLDTSVLMYRQIATAHNTTQAQLKKSLAFYESRPDLFKIIIDTLQRRAQLPLAAYGKDLSQQLKKDSASRKLFQKPMLPKPKLP